eukprot:m.213620 g.213620  ORF g.213620 m.213620 type:complete len:160 (-) comp26744_c0_seq1:121-600(-)
MNQLRAFVIARYHTGVLLIRGRELAKADKPAHWQLPGGRVDPDSTPLATAVDEFHEETGIWIDKERLQPVLNPEVYGGRHFFIVNLTDADSVSPKKQRAIRVKSKLGNKKFYVQLSNEHTDAMFEADLNKCAKMVRLHSKGHNSRALLDMEAIIRFHDP